MTCEQCGCRLSWAQGSSRLVSIGVWAGQAPADLAQVNEVEGSQGFECALRGGDVEAGCGGDAMGGRRSSNRDGVQGAAEVGGEVVNGCLLSVPVRGQAISQWRNGFD